MRNWLKIFVLFMVLLTQTFAAEDFLREKALNGDVDAMLKIGHEFFYGQNRMKNPELAAYYFKMASLQNSGEAFFNLGSCYEYGFGVPLSLIQAYECYLKAGDIPAAKFKIAMLLRTGIGAEKTEEVFRRSVKADLKRSRSIINDLVKTQYPPAMSYLANELLLAKNPGQANIDYALELLKNAESKHDVLAMRLLGECFYRGVGVEIDPEQSFIYFKKAADAGDVESTVQLGVMYEYGIGVPPDLTKSYQCFKSAADSGNSFAKVKLADHLLSGFLVASDIAQAIDLYEDAAFDNNSAAMLKLGLCYASGIGVEKNENQAFLFFLKAAAAGEVEAQYNIAIFFRDGKGTPIDRTAVVYWLKKAAQAGHIEAYRELGICYINGYGVEKDLVKGNQLLRQAAKGGDVVAQEAYKEL